MQFNRRQFPRKKCSIESSFQAHREPANLCETTVFDISQGGLRFRTYKFIPLQTRLNFKMKLPKNKSIDSIVEPAWIKEVPHLNLFEIGARFISLDEDDQTLVRALTIGIA